MASGEPEHPPWPRSLPTHPARHELMIGSFVMVAALAAGGDVPRSNTADVLAQHQTKTLSVGIPLGWERKVVDGTERFSAPSGKASFTLDVGAVQTSGMKPAVCLGKILTAMDGDKGWQRLSIASNPAARKVQVDNAKRNASDKGRSISYVGCNGKTTWSLIFSFNEKEQDRFEPLLAKIAQSIAYRR
jgi:hypothetical protein